jgi:hypothetical protein
VGYSGGSGSIVQTGGTNNANTIALYAGNYQLSGNGVLNARSLVFNVSGDVFQQSGGTATISNLSSGGGEVQLSGGVLATGANQLQATVIQSGGTFTTPGLILFNGHYTLNDGLLSATGRSSLQSGTFAQSGGTFRAGVLDVAIAYPLTGSASLQANELDVRNAVTLQSSSASANVTGDVYVGWQRTAGSLALQSDGATMTVGGNLHVGSVSSLVASPGTVTHPAGTLNVNHLLVGDTAAGTYTLSGSGLLNATTLDVGSASTGTLTQTGGRNVVGTMTLGTLPGGSGTYTLSGGTLLANNLCVGGTGSARGGVATLNLQGGTATISGTFSAYSGNPMTLTAGTLTAANFVNGALLNHLGGSANFDAVTGTGSIFVGGSTAPATLTVAQLTQASLTVSSKGTVRIRANASNPFTNAARVGLGGTGTLDLNDQDLLTPTSPTTIRGYLAAGYHGGAWNGTNGGIISTAASTSAAPRTLAYATAADLTARTIPAGQTLVTYTVPGDADLDGAVDFNDFLSLQNAYGSSGDWAQGDFNFDGVVDYSDYLILQADYGLSLSGGAVMAAPYLAPLPEPASLSLLALATTALLAGRRGARRSRAD